MTTTRPKQPSWFARGSTVTAVRLAITYAFCAAVGFTMLLPLAWMVATSLRTKTESYKFPSEWLPWEKHTYAEIEGKLTEVRVLRDKAILELVDDGDASRIRAEYFRPPDKIEAFATQLRGSKAVVRVLGISTDGRPVEAKVLRLFSLVKVNYMKPDEKLLAVDTASLRRERKLRPQWSNYPGAARAVSIGRAYQNSIFIALVVCFGQVFTSSLAAFAFARLRWPGRDKVFFAYLATMMIPATVTIIPRFAIINFLPSVLNRLTSPQGKFWSSELYLFGKRYAGAVVGIDSFFALTIPMMFTAYGTFMLRQFFMGIPKDLEDAARIDGCSLWGIYRHVIMALSKPALATLTVFTFMGAWRNFMWPLIVLNSPELFPIPVMLRMFQQEFRTEYSLLMAGSLVSMLPIVVAFLGAQRYFVSGIRLGALKE